MIKLFKLLFILSILISLGIFIANTDLFLVKQSLLQIGENFYWLLLITGLAYLLGAIAWQYCLGDERSKVNLFHLFWIRMIGETVSLFNPGSIVGGDLLKVALLKPYAIKKTTAINAVVISRFLMILSQLLMFIIAWLILSYQSDKIIFRELMGAAIKGVGIFSGAIMILFILKKRNGRFVIKHKLLKKWIHYIKTTLQQSYSYYKQEKRATLISFSIYCLHWLIGSLEFFFLLRFLKIDIQVIDGLMIDMGVIFFKSAGAFIPGQLGIEEYGNRFMLLMLGVNSAGLWLSISILRRVRQLFWLVLSFCSYIYYGRCIRLQTA